MNLLRLFKKKTQPKPKTMAELLSTELGLSVNDVRSLAKEGAELINQKIHEDMEAISRGENLAD